MSSRHCPNCGHQITADDRFCSNCGTRLETIAPGSGTADQDIATGSIDTEGSRESVLPTLGRKNAWEYERDRVQSAAQDEEWRMSDLGPPPPPRRRTWLWIVLGILGAMVLPCCIFLYWVGYTDGGQEWFEGIATEAAEIVEATQQASATPQS